MDHSLVLAILCAVGAAWLLGVTLLLWFAESVTIKQALVWPFYPVAFCVCALVILVSGCGFTVDGAATMDARPLDTIDTGAAIDTASPVDAASSIDAPLDSAVTLTLAQTNGPGTAQAVGCTVSGTISDGAWYRVFPLSNYGVTSILTIRHVALWVWRTQGARTATITIGMYDGGAQTTAFQPTLFHPFSPESVTVPSASPSGQFVTLTLAAPIVIADPTSTIAVKIASSDLLLGETASQTAYGYFGSNTCGQSATLPNDAPGSGFIVTLIGTE